MAIKKFESIFLSRKIKGYKVGDTIIRDYLRDKATRVKLGSSPKKLLESRKAKNHSITEPKPGKLLFYHYDPKHKDILPYYDKFPITFPIDVNMKEGYFLGLNLHYLPPIPRTRLLDNLFETLNNSKFDDRTKLMINYKMLKNASKFKYFEPCIKKYLFSHVRSDLIEIPSDEWDYVVFLPLARFEKASQRKVWDDSMDRILG